MATYEIASSPVRYDPHMSRPIELVCFGLCVAHVAYLAASFFNGAWLVGGPVTDFVNVWAAGRLVLDGAPAAAYDWAIHKQVEIAAVGHPFDGYFAWYYPPPFLFVATLLALIPYSSAYAAWTFVTLPVYVAVIRGIVADRVGILLACAFPAVLSNALLGQNGFLTAALLGAALYFIPHRPILAGVFLGLLSYKPQFGLLFPLALMAGGYWRTFISAALTTGVVAGASWLAFGTEAWLAFVASLPRASEFILTEGNADWAKLQSVFGLVRIAGGGASAAWTSQVAFIAAAALAVTMMWRSQAKFELKAAVLAIGALLATPYVYIYDLVVLAVPIAFLIREGLLTAPLRGEVAAAAAATLLIVIFPFVKMPVGFAAVLIVAALIARRVLAQQLQAGASPSPKSAPA